MQKIWKNSADGQDGNGKYSATFQLQQQIEGSSDWTDVTGAIYTLTSDVANDDTQSYTWNSLPKYTSEGKQITYRAVETKINGVDVSGDSHAADVNGYSSGSYIVTYQYRLWASVGAVVTEESACAMVSVRFVASSFGP